MSLAGTYGAPAVVHDWLTIPGGSEQVVVEMLRLLPEAEIYTSIYDPAPWPPEITSRRVHTSFLDRLPGARRHYPKLLPLMNAAFERFDLSRHDLVISSSHSSAKNVRTPEGTLHVCYCYTPMRHAWEPHLLAGELGRAEFVARAFAGRLRRVDRAAADRPDGYIAISRHVAERIRRAYGREAILVHPPVAVEEFLATPRDPRGYYLVLGRLVPYKRADLAVAACTRLGRPLKVAGSGRDLKRVRAAAGPGIEFLGRVDDAARRELLAGARALLFCGLEDFGMVPVEALAAGVPVIAFGRGGVLDTIRDGDTGVLFEHQEVEDVVAAIRRFEGLTFDPEVLRAAARPFAPKRFRRELERAVDEIASAATP